MTLTFVDMQIHLAPGVAAHSTYARTCTRTRTYAVARESNKAEVVLSGWSARRGETSRAPAANLIRVILKAARPVNTKSVALSLRISSCGTE